MFDKQSYEDQSFTELVHEEALIEGIEFQDCSFSKCTFTGTTFKSCKFKDCTFVDCDLSLAKVDYSTFKGVIFEKSKLVGINWALASWDSNGLLPLLNPISFVECVLNYSSFTGLELESLQIEKCTANEVDFSEANLEKSSFQGTDLSGSIFRNTRLTEANFIEATNYAINPEVNIIKQAQFSIPEAMSLLYSMDIEIIE